MSTSLIYMYKVMKKHLHSSYVLERIIIQVAVILIFGDFLADILNIKKHSLNLAEHSVENFINSSVLGYGSLMVPMLVVAIFTKQSLNVIVYAYFGTAVIISLIRLTLFLSRVNRYTIEIDFDTEEKYYLFIIISFVIVYLFISLILPERGWDALHYYIPDGFYFFLVDGMPSGVNPLSLFPTFKAPFISFIVTYSFYVTNGFYAHLHPFVMLIATMLLVYKFAMKLGYGRRIGLLSTIFFLATPIVYYIIISYAFYQEIPLMLFFTATLYYFYDIEENIRRNGLLGSIAFGLTIMSKISGLVLFFVIFVSFNIQYLHTRIKQLIIIAVTIFLSQKSLYNLYFGTAIFVLILGVFIAVLVEFQENNPVLSIKSMISAFIIPVSVVIIWFIFLLRVPEINSLLFDTFVKTTSNQISTTYPSFQAKTIANFENGMRVTFWAGLLYPLTGMAMVLPWAIAKLFSFFSIRKYNFLLSWLYSYIIFHYAYFMEVSVRYFMPVIVAISILVAVGFKSILDRFKLSNRSQLVMTGTFISTGILFYVPLLPIRNIRGSIFFAFYHYHESQIVLLAYLCLIILFFKVIANKLRGMDPSKIKRYSNIALVTSMVLPMAFPLGTSILAGFEGKQPMNYMTYTRRASFEDLVDAVKTQDITQTDIILSFNTPGLEYFIASPVLDLAVIPIQGQLKPELIKLNQTESFELMKEEGITHVILPNEDNLFYGQYQEQVAFLDIFEIVQDGPNFDLVYENREYLLFERINNDQLILV